MARLSVSTVRGRFDTALTGAGFTRSRVVPELFGRNTDHLLPLSFAVAVPSTSLQDFDGRERYGTEGEALTTVEIKTAYRIRPDNQSADYGSALDHEASVLTAVLGTINLSDMQVRPDGIPRRTVPSSGDWLISTITFSVYHRIDFD
jgi:hypothetical protein